MSQASALRPSKVAYKMDLIDAAMQASGKTLYEKPHIPVEEVRSPLLSSLKKRLHEVNKALSEISTVISYILQSVDMTTKEPLFASVSLIEYFGPVHRFEYFNPMYMRKIENVYNDIFCTSDENTWRKRGTLHDDKSIYTRTNSTYVFLLGEAGCGKTTYCLNLLGKWCQGDELQKFDFVFYVDLSTSETQKKSLPHLISSSCFGDMYNESDIDAVLQREKCLVLMDGGQYLRGSTHQFLDESFELVRYSNNCVFVLIIRPLDFMHKLCLHPFLLKDKNFRIIQLLGLDNSGITSLYSIINDICRFSGSQYKKELVEYPKSMKGVSSEKEIKDHVRENTQTYPIRRKSLQPNEPISYLEEQFKDSSFAKLDKDTSLQEDTKEGIEEFNKEGWDFNQIKEFLEKSLLEKYNSIMRIPMLGFVCVNLLEEKKQLPRNITGVYFCLIDKLAYYKTDDASSKIGEKSIAQYRVFQPFENINRHFDILCKLGKVAYESLLHAEPEVLNYNRLEKQMKKEIIVFSMKTRFIVPFLTIGVKESTEKYVRFLHKSIEECLAVIYIVSKQEVFESFCQRLKSVDNILDMSHVIMMICGLNPSLGSSLSRVIKDTLEQDDFICHHREVLTDIGYIKELFKLQLSWYIEYESAIGMITSDTIHIFYLPYIYVDDLTDAETLAKSIALLSHKNANTKSVCVSFVPISSGLSDRKLDNFLAFNTSLESLTIEDWITKRSVKPLDFPSLRVLKLQCVRVNHSRSGDDAVKSLLSNLPLLQRLDLYYVELNNGHLGLSSNTGKMPLLKRIHIQELDMGEQSIELAPDMTVIEYIRLFFVNMIPEAWFKFITSIIENQHSFDVEIFESNIDTKSQNLIRRNKNFIFKKDNPSTFHFKRRQ